MVFFRDGSRWKALSWYIAEKGGSDPLYDGNGVLVEVAHYCERLEREEAPVVGAVHLGEV